jgi:hypothetical protein
MKLILPFILLTGAKLVSSNHICSKYTKALFTNDTADNQLLLIQSVVDLAVLGDSDLNVPGIYSSAGGLVPFFKGTAGNTTNRGGVPVSINFIDNGSNQDTLLQHLYQFFGAVLGCRAAGFPEYEGVDDMYEVHKFMGITYDQNNYFIGQVGASASALGVTDEDVTIVASILNTTFNTRCPPIVTDTVIAPNILVGTNPSICTDISCPLAINTTCVDGPDSAPVSSPVTVNDATLCMKYTTALFTNDTADNELALIQAVVNLAVLGDAEMNVSGILAPEGGLVAFFSGAAGNTTNRGTPVSINFLDGATNQETLLMHLYQFFGALLGCTAAGFPQYAGNPDMYDVHKFMGITLDQNNYFIGQVGAAASALGVTDDDVAVVAGVLDGIFNTRCPPPLTESDGVPSFLVGTNPSICTDNSCPLAINATCNDSPGNATLCSKYTTALFMSDTAENELTLITAVVNLAVLGNATLNVPGILAAAGGLKSIFDGSAGKNANRGGSAVTINFLDGGTNTDTLLQHLYQFFGALLGCTAAGFPAYSGVADMYQVHRFMGITLEQNNYFIGQVGAAASALGVSDDDVMTVANVLDGTFNTRCPPVLATSDGVPDFLVGTNPSICTDSSCPLDMDSTDTTCNQAAVPTKSPVLRAIESTSDATTNTKSIVTMITAIIAWSCLM